MTKNKKKHNWAKTEEKIIKTPVLCYRALPTHDQRHHKTIKCKVEQMFIYNMYSGHSRFDIIMVTMKKKKFTMHIHSNMQLLISNIPSTATTCPLTCIHPVEPHPLTSPSADCYGQNLWEYRQRDVTPRVQIWKHLVGERVREGMDDHVGVWI